MTPATKLNLVVAVMWLKLLYWRLKNEEEEETGVYITQHYPIMKLP